MARIRTIKPEFPQSESMGRVSREARLCFILLWTIADDEGRLRGNSRMLASLLYPYDDDAPKLISKWLTELEQEGCVIVYEVEKNHYIQICNWLNHQKIDRPSTSKIEPPSNPRESSRILPVVSKDQGSKEGIKDQGQKPAPATRLPADWQLSDIDFSFCKKERPDLDPQKTADGFRDYWIGVPGAKGKKQDWAATWRNWVRGQRAASRISVADDRKVTLDGLTGKGNQHERDITGEAQRVA